MELQPGVPGGEDEPLELAPRAPPPVAAAPVDPTPGYEPLPHRYRAKKSRLFPIALTLFVLLIAAAAGFVVLGREGVIPRGWVPRWIDLGRFEAPVQVLTIQSLPSGATVLLNGVEVGETPLARENDYPPGARVEVKLVLRGHKPWTGSFVGGQKANVQAQLQRR